MVRYLSLLVLAEVYDATEWVQNEQDQLKKMLADSKAQLTPLQAKIVINRARRLASEYENILEEEEYGYDADEYDYRVDFDQAEYELWKHAVRKQLTVELVYDSTTSGVSKRLVDPYRSSAPYVEGYCHTRKEVRKFRFDRVISITLTEKSFSKPKTT